MGKVRLSKNQLRREKAKKRKLEETTTDANEKPVSPPEPEKKPSTEIVKPTNDNDNDNKTEKEQEKERLLKDLYDPNSPAFQQFQGILSKFGGKRIEKAKSPSPAKQQLIKKEVVESSDEYESDEETVSKRQLRRQTKVPISTLKAIARNPQLVELSDIDANDPFILLSIKQNLNVVPVPSHWSSKRDYLSSKRGIEKAPFELPSYILETGIQDMRNSDLSLRQQQRDRTQPKLGKLDIDFQKLHDAFFKYQTRPKLLAFGDVYYEGRETTDESDDKLGDIKPGRLSRELLVALGLPENGKTVPPWISTMNQLGKPPSYNNLIIPGIDITYANAGYLKEDEEIVIGGEETHWGEIEREESEEEDSDDEESEEEIRELEDPDEPIVPYDNELSDEDKPEEKVNIKPSLNEDKKLYTVIKDKDATVGDGLLSTDKVYDLGKDNSEPTSESHPQPKESEEQEQEQEQPKFKF